MREKNKFMICLGSLILVIFLLAVPWKWGSSTTESLGTEAMEIVCLGDSIIGNIKGETGIAYLLQEQTGISVYDCTIGGTCAVSLNDLYFEDYYFDAFSFENLSWAIAGRDYHTIPQQGVGPATVRAITKDVAQLLPQIDFTQIDCMILSYGTNDYMCGISKDVYEEVMRDSIERLKNAYPQLKIVLLSPMYCYVYGNDGELLGCDEQDFGGGTLPDYVKSAERVAEECGIYFLNQYEAMGIGLQNADQYLLDGVHPNVEGRQLYTQKLTAFLRDNDILQ